jgi:hypothetical protein
MVGGGGSGTASSWGSNIRLAFLIGKEFQFGHEGPADVPVPGEDLRFLPFSRVTADPRLINQ